MGGRCLNFIANSAVAGNAAIATIRIVGESAMPADLASTLVIVARLLLGGAFVFAGLRNIANRTALVGVMSARGVPQARLVLDAGIVLQVAAGLLVMAGISIPYAAAALIAFLVVATVMFHNFWDHAGIDRGNRINGVVSNVALTAGFLLLIAGS
jgi:putative oxidoreductase